MTVTYPTSLPVGLRGSRTYQVVSPLQRSALVSGRSRQRRKYTSVPEMAKVSFLYNNAESMAFVAWFRDALVDGSLWFECPLKTEMGLDYHTCRFTDIYEGPNPVGPNLWSVSGEIEIKARVALPIGWGEFPDLIIGSKIIDIAMNIDWPQYAQPSEPEFLFDDGVAFLFDDGTPFILEN